MCDGKELRVTRNLCAALTRIRNGFFVRNEWANEWNSRPVPLTQAALWVDAICINQEDDCERTSQVALIDEIYKISRRLLIWLGDSLGFEEEQIFHDLFEGRFLPGEMTRNLRAASLFMALLTRSWFGRRWIVQEIAFTPYENRWIIIGTFVIKVQTLVEKLQPLALPNVDYQLTLLGNPRFTNGMIKYSFLSTMENMLAPSARILETDFSH